jgi:nucleotidyltransferase substrate binding protein (TIGR01987 family)
MEKVLPKLAPVTATPDVRWKQRFQNFERALVLLREAMQRGPTALNALEKEGTVQRFEYCFELAWKTAKDYLEYQGSSFVLATPRQVLKDAFAVGLLPDGQVWIEMLDQRSILAHTYSQESFVRALEAIHTRYLAALSGLHECLAGEAAV